ncbi:MAG: hypothetical protein IKO39_00415, partial [Treponema sp.]|nr:hypothetical protein [Treponema sp.]
MDEQTKLFNSMVEQVFNAENDVEQIRSHLYKYENFMTSIITSSRIDKNPLLQVLNDTELEIRNQLVIHSEIMKKMEFGSEKERLFRSVND